MTTIEPGDEQQPEPSPDGKPFRRKHSGAQRLVLGLSIVVIIACFVGAGVLLAAKNTVESFAASPDLDITAPPTVGNSVDPGPPATDPETGETVPPETFPPADPAAKNFLITGADNNSCIDPTSPWASAGDPDRPGGERSDTIMVIRVDPSTQRAAVLSFPRDLWVKIDGRGKSRINSAYVKGDPTTLANTISQNFGVVVDYAIQIDFCAFKQLVDAVGGVSVPFEFPIYDDTVGLNIPTAGCHSFSGDEALAYVRSRHLHYIDANGKKQADPSSDLGRISRQQDFLRRVLRATLDKGILNPSVASGIIESMQNYIVRSNDLTLDVMLSFLGVIRDVDPSSLPTYQIEASRLITGGNDVLEPRLNGENMKAILAIFRGEAPLAGAPAQVFETTTTAAGATTTTGKPSSTTTTTPTVDTVPGPEENAKGIVPPKDVQC